MRSKTTIVLSVIVLLLLVTLVGGAVFLKSDYAAERMCRAVQGGLQDALGVPVTMGRCRIGLLPPTLETGEVEIQAPDGSRLARIERLRVELDSLALLTGRVRLDRVRVTRPELHLKLIDGRLTNLPTPASGGGGDGGSGGSLFPEHIELEDARLNLVVDKLALVQLKSLQASLVVKGGDRYELGAEVGGGSLDLAGGRGDSFELAGCRLKAGVEGSIIALDHFSLELGELSIDAHGKLALSQDGPRPELNLRITGPMNLLHRFLPDIPPMEGVAVVSADTLVGENGLEARGALDVKGFAVETARGINVKSGFRVNLKQLEIENLSASSPAGTVTGKARLGLAAPWEFEGKLVLEDVNLTESLRHGGIQESPVLLRGAGSTGFRGKFAGKVGPYVILNTRLNLNRLAVRPQPGQPALVSFKSASISLETAFTGRRVRFGSIKLGIGKSLITGEGKIYFHGGRVSAAVNAGDLNLADVSPLAGMDLGGVASFGLTVEGAFPQPQLRLELDAGDLTFEQRPVGRLRGTVLVADGRLRLDNLVVVRRGGMARIDANLDLEPPHPLSARVELAGARLPEVLALARGTRPSYATLDGLLGGELLASGSLEAPVLDFKLGFQQVRVGDQIFEEGGVIGKLDAGRWELDLLEARMGPGWIFARGSISPDLTLDLTAYSTGLQAGSFRMLAGIQDTLDFRLDLHVAVKGPIRSPALTGWAKVYDTRLKGKSLLDSFVSARATTESFEVTGRFLGETAHLSGRARLESGLPFLAELDFETENLGDYLNMLTDAIQPKATTLGRVNASGHLLNPRSITAKLRIEGFSVEAAGVRLKNRQPLLVILDAGKLKLKQFDFEGTDTVLSIQGGGTLRGGADLRAEGTMGLGLLSLLVDFVPKAAGSVNLRLGLKGPWSSPRLAGSAAFRADLLRFSFLPQDIRSTTGVLEFTPEMIEVTRLRGEMGGGKFTGQGWVEMKSFSPERYSLNLEPERVRYNVTPNLWGVGSGSLSIQGSRKSRLLLSGDIRLHQAAYTERIALASLSDGIFRHRLRKTRTYAVEREVADFNINLRIPEQFKVRYNLDLVNFQAEMKGNIRLTGTNERLGLKGDLDALEGKITYLSKNFDLQSTTIQFVDEYSIHPRVEVLAERTETVDRGDEGKTDYQIRLRLNVDGNAAPEISLTSDPALEPHDIATLLTLGVTTREVESLKSEDLVGLGGEILLRSFKLDERLGRMFPFPPEVIQPKYLRVRSRFNPATDSGQSGTVSPRVEVGAKLRLISDDLDVDYSRSLYDDTSQSLDFSYRLSEGVSTRLRWENANETALGDVGDLGLDLKLHWEW